MNTPALLLFLALPLAATAQSRTEPDFQLIRITRNLITPPQFVYTGAQQYPANRRDRWLEVEAEFTARPDVTDDLTFNYFILINGRLLTGEVTHTSIGAGRENRSVMYASPPVLARFIGPRTMALSLVQNICVQIVQQGLVKDELSLVRAQSPCFTGLGLPRAAGLLLNKAQTPFAPLYWDRYAQVKTPP